MNGLGHHEGEQQAGMPVERKMDDLQTEAEAAYRFLMNLIREQVIKDSKGMVRACKLLVDKYQDMDISLLQKIRNFLQTIDKRTEGHSDLLNTVLTMIKSKVT